MNQPAVLVSIEHKQGLIQVSPGQILVNGYVVAKTFQGFKKFCEANELTQDHFKNWPFDPNELK